MAENGCPDNRDDIPGMSGQRHRPWRFPFDNKGRNDFPRVGLTARLPQKPKVIRRVRSAIASRTSPFCGSRPARRARHVGNEFNEGFSLGETTGLTKVSAPPPSTATGLNTAAAPGLRSSLCLRPTSAPTFFPDGVWQQPGLSPAPALTDSTRPRRLHDPRVF